MPPVPEKLDEHACALYLEVPRAQLVALQAYFETYEGVGLVRTLDMRRSLVCILTTPAMLDDCLRLLAYLQPEIGWQTATRPPDLDAERFLGYFKRNRYAETLS